MTAGTPSRRQYVSIMARDHSPNLDPRTVSGSCSLWRTPEREVRSSSADPARATDIYARSPGAPTEHLVSVRHKKEAPGG